MGLEALYICQYGLESSHGTPVAADTRLGCIVGFPEDDREKVAPMQSLGTRMGRNLDAAYTKRVLADGITVNAADGAYFQLLPWALSCGLRGNISPSAGGDGDYTWTFAVNQTGTEDIDSSTLEGADDTGAYESAYCMMKSFTMGGAIDEGDVTFNSEWFGDKVIPTTKTPAISFPSVSMMYGKTSQVYIDSSWANLGNTELANCLVNWEISVETGTHPKFWGSSQREFDGHNQGYVEGQLVLTFERTSGVYAEEAYYRHASTYGATTRFVRLTNTGPIIGGATPHSVTFDVAGIWTSWGSIGTSKNGNNLDVATLSFGYDLTGAQGLSIDVVTDVAAI